MRRCPQCSKTTAAEGSFCPQCGARFDEPVDLTRTSMQGQPTTPASFSASSGAPHDERFLPGAVLVGRYRIVAPVGRGGMGEVYRADDLKLGQPVALKFLPPELEQDPSRLERLLGEVRIARQISHPNVCRVYDIGEVDGRHYLSMEFVDGEDLATLLRRIGRLPGDKAVELARQVCAGLAAAHDQGILHRDLKPANVMIDGRGRAKVTDFGLAALASDVQGAEIRVGTPAYMAPEQRAGSAVSVRSDLYSLGLLLYEMFTGKEAFAAKSVAELDRVQRESTPASLSSVIEGIDAAVERVVLRCLEPDPADRPSSALAVAMALPGGDPLAASLAAGETPSPEMVAAAGGEGTLTPIAAAGWLALMLIAAALFGAIYTKVSLLAYAPAEKPPQVLAERAREIAHRLGHTERAADEAFGFLRNPDAVRWISANDPGADRWSRLREHRPATLFFWYRQSPRPLVPASGSEVGYFDPPPIVSNMVWLQTDPRGRLIGFLAAPPQVDDATEPIPEPDWSAVFAEAQLSQAEFTPVAPRWDPLLYADTRRAWKGEFPERPGSELRVEAASYRGKITYVSLAGPWTRAGRMTAFEETSSRRFGWVLYITCLIAAVTTAIVLARRNVRSGRGDRKGAFRLAMYLLGAQFIVWALSAHHVFDFAEEWQMLERASAVAIYTAGLAWIIYLALEPFVRRRWPESIIGWTRLLSGRVRDPRVGREILMGAALGAVLAVTTYSHYWLAQTMGAAMPPPPSTMLAALLGPRHAASVFVAAHLSSAIFAMFLFFFLFMGIAWTKVRWPGVAIFVGISTLMTFLFMPAGPIWIKLPVCVTWGVLVAAMFMRAGLLGAVVGLLVGNATPPLIFDTSAWYAGQMIAIWAVLVALAVYGFRIALGGRPLVAGRAALGSSPSR